jgi:hypothetical protein
MVSRKSLGVIAILTLIVVVAAWSKLRFVDPEDHAPQRWKVEEHPDFRLRG